MCIAERKFEAIDKTGVTCTIPCWWVEKGLVGTPCNTHYIVLTDKHIAYGIKAPAYYKQRFAVCRNSEAPKQPSGQRRICYVFNPKVWLDSISEL